MQLFNPRHDDWDTHFKLDIETARISGLTPQGRVTVFLLRINDEDRIMDRKLLIAANRYPCQKD